MKIAFFTDTFLPQINGVSKTLARFSKHLESKNIDHQIFAPGSNSSTFPNVKELLSVPFAIYPECRFSFPNVFRIHSELQDFQPDIIHSATEFNTGITGMNYAKKNNLPFVTSYHTNFAEYLKYYHLEKLEPVLWNYLRWFHEKSEMVLCPSLATIDSLGQRGFQRLELWSRGIDAAQFSPEYSSGSFLEKHGLQDKIVLLYVGRISPEKNLETLAESYRQLQQTYSDSISLIITGNGPWLEQARSMFAEDVIFTGYKEGLELSEIYASSDIFVFPSLTETFGNVVLEAMASGLPVVCFNSGGVKDNVIHGQNGFLAQTTENNEFTKHIQVLIDNPALQKRMSVDARQFALSKDWSQIFDGVINSYQRIADFHQQKNQISA